MAASATVGILRVLLSANTAEFEAAMASAGKSVNAWQKELGTIGQQATAAGALLTGALTVPIAAIGVGATKAAMDFETAFADVAKTVDGVAEATGKLTPQGEALALVFRDMAKEIPATTTELSKIAALGGQMGVPIEQLEHFTRNVAALGVAVDGISAETAAAGLAQIGNAAGVGSTQVQEMASTLVHLGNSSNATEGQILEMTQRLVGAGTTVGMTIPQIMALATSMSNVGIEAEKGGTAMSTVIQKIGIAVSENSPKLAEFARVAGMSADDFAAKWKTSPVEAIEAVILGLNRMKGEGTDLNLTMLDLGLKGIRVSDTMKLLAGSGDDVTKMLVIANEGWAAQDKHLIEAEKKYATTANELKVLWNTITDLGITLGGVFLPLLKSAVTTVEFFIPVIKAVVDVFAAMPAPIQMGVIALAGLLAAIGPLLMAFGLFVTTIAPLTPLFVALVPTISAVAAAIMGIGTVILGFISGPVLLIGAAIAGLAVIWFTWGEDIKRITGQALEAVKGYFSIALSFITGLWTTLKTNVVTLASSMMQSIKTWLVDFWEGSIFQSIARMLEALYQLWVAIGVRILVEVTKLAVGVKNWLVEQLAPVVEGAKALLTALGDAYTKLKDAVIERVTALYTGVKSWLQDKLTPVFAAVKAFLDPVLAAWTAAKDKVISVATALYEGVKTWLVDKFTAVVDAIKAKIDAVTGFFKDMKDKVVGRSYVPEMVDAIGVEIARLDGLMVQPVLKYTDGVGDLFAGMQTEVTGLMGGLVRNVDTSMTTMKTQTGNTLQALGQSFTQMFSNGIPGIFQSFTQGPLAQLISQVGGSLGGKMQQILGTFQGIMRDGFTVASGIARAFAGDFSGIIDAIMAGINLIKSAWGALSGLFSGGEEGTQVNPARDAFLAQFGPRGTGAGSGFWNLGLALEGAVGYAQAEALHAALRSADTMAEFSAAVSAINSALGGGGYVAPTFTGSGGGYVAPTSYEAPEEIMGIEEQMRLGLMAEGGFGKVTRPTLFLAGEAGPEEFAFSGANKSFGSGGQAPITINFNGPVFGEEEYIQTTVVDNVLEAIRMNRNGSLTRFQAVAEIG